MTVNGLKQYKNNVNMVDDEDKGLLLLKVFQEIISKLDIIATSIESKDFQKKCDEILKVKQVLEIMHDSVDTSYGEISKNLQSLYLYIIKRLNETNIKNDINAVFQCKTLIKTIYEGFEEAYRKEKTNKGKKNNIDEYTIEPNTINSTLSEYKIAGVAKRGYI